MPALVRIEIVEPDHYDGRESRIMATGSGAIITPDSLARAWALGMSPLERLDNNDGHGFFEALGDSVRTGPTLTNVNDFRAILIDAP